MRYLMAVAALLAATWTGCAAPPARPVNSLSDRSPASGVNVTLGHEGQVFVDGKPTIPLAVWTAPVYLFEYFHEIGLNCVVVANMEDPDLFRYRSADPSAVAAKTGLAIVSQADADPKDPQVWGILDGVLSPRGVNMDRATQRLAELHTKYPGRFVMTNISVHQFINGQNADAFRAGLRTTDAIICHVWPEANGERNLRNVALVVDRVRELCKDRPGGEVSIWPDINSHEWSLKQSEGGTHFHAPTRAELRFQIWLALIHGADGICFFPISFDPFVYAQIPAQSEKEIAWNSRLIERMAPVLTAKPSTLAITTSGDLAGGILDVTTREFEGKHYVFLVNGQDKPQTLTLKAPGLGSAWQLSDVVSGKAVATPGGVLTEKLDGLALRIWKLEKK